MIQALQQSNNDLPFSLLEDELMLSEQLEAKVAAARQTMERAVGCRLEIERFEPVEVEGNWVLRVFWRKVLAS
jgi:hypothetical protein